MFITLFLIVICQFYLEMTDQKKIRSRLSGFERKSWLKMHVKRSVTNEKKFLHEM